MEANSGIPVQKPTCIGCGYSLLELTSDNCPECGRYFDRDDESTFRMAWQPAPRRRSAAPPSMWECVGLGVLTILGLLGASNAQPWNGPATCIGLVFGVPVWVGLAIQALWRAGVCWKDRARSDLDQSPLHKRHAGRWFVAPICFLVVVSAIITPWPLMLRFGLSRPAFEAAVRDVQSGKGGVNGRIGLYFVRRVTWNTTNPAGSTILFETGSDFFDPVGFMFDPVRDRTRTDIIQQLGPQWYTYID